MSKIAGISFVFLWSDERAAAHAHFNFWVDDAQPGKVFLSICLKRELRVNHYPFLFPRGLFEFGSGVLETERYEIAWDTTSPFED